MATNIIIQGQALNSFLSEEKGKVMAFLQKRYSVSQDDLEDIYQESSIALYLNIQNRKLTQLSCTLSTYFLQICINQTLKHIRKQKKILPLIDNTISTSDCFIPAKVEELYDICTEDESTERKTRSEHLVQEIVNSMLATCKDIFMGYYWDNLSTSAIADMLGLANSNSVKTQKYKCLQKFRNKYNELIKKTYE